jgi:PIN domain nuclease of toxin-antitoxin system
VSSRYLLDTYVVISLRTQAEFDNLPLRVRKLLEAPQSELLISTISQMEIAVKHSIGRLNFPQQELETVCVNAGLEFLAFEEHHARYMYQLPMHHRDPFDRALIATAVTEGIQLLSPDRAFSRYEALQVIWG